MFVIRKFPNASLVLMKIVPYTSDISTTNYKSFGVSLQCTFQKKCDVVHGRGEFPAVVFLHRAFIGPMSHLFDKKKNTIFSLPA